MITLPRRPGWHQWHKLQREALNQTEQFKSMFASLLLWVCDIDTHNIKALTDLLQLQWRTPFGSSVMLL
jgi:hypothetical protein